MPKQRLDQQLVQLGLAESKSKAQALIAGGYVQVNGVVVSKPAKAVTTEDEIRLNGKEHRWVSRGGIKLAHALAHFNCNPQGMVAIDVGASTGGFTDVLLQHGAAKVFAVDVGTGQLHARLRTHAAVVSLEQTNARELTCEHIPKPVDLVVCDASFISLSKVLPAALALTKPQAQLITLIKPQFEVGKQLLGKAGVVRDETLHQHTCDDVTNWLNALPGWQVQAITPSPIFGPKGNKEFLLWAQKGL